MDLREIMDQHVYVVVGDTLNESKFAYRIKEGLAEKGYCVYAVGKELESINDVPGQIDIIDMCIHPAKGIKLLQENTKECKCVVLQPGAESDEIKGYLREQKIPYAETCLLEGMCLYSK